MALLTGGFIVTKCGLFLLLVSFAESTNENYKNALFAKPDVIQKADILYKKVSQNVTTDMDKTVEHILKWLQMRFQEKARTTRQETKNTNERPAYLLQPQPFRPADNFNGYPTYDTSPTPYFYIDNQTELSTSPLSVTTDQPYTYFYTKIEAAPDTKDIQPLQEGFQQDGYQDIQYNDTTNHVSNEFQPVQHPPHIHAIDVQCSKDKMIINIEFNEVFNGIIYSKGYYNDLSCHYVMRNSEQVKYTFVVQMNSCGTQFIDEFQQGKKAYLENVLVLQNEPGIQEVWDTIRSVRCLWEGNIKQTLSAGLNVETLTQDILTFSGDMVTARLDIQVGKGPGALPANGLIKIGEPMTLVVTVDGDSAFNILVKDCNATDGNPNSGNLIQLTDNQGCILKPKLFGNFQMIKSPDINRPGVIAYAYFQAFKFPDVMDLLIECNVELCKAQCQSCPSQTTETIRQKRLVNNGNEAMDTSKSIRNKIHIFNPEDFLYSPSALLSSNEQGNQICISTITFYAQNIVTITILFSSCVIIISYWFKLRSISKKSHLLF